MVIDPSTLTEEQRAALKEEYKSAEYMTPIRYELTYLFGLEFFEDEDE